MPDGVVFYPSYYEAIKDLPDQERLGVYDAIMRYGLYGELVEMSSIVKTVFTLVKPNVDSSQNRYRAAKSNGSKGGRPRKNQTENQIENQTQNQDTDSDSEKEIDSEKEMEEEKESPGGNGETANGFSSAPYKPLSEGDFERKRSERLRMLGFDA